MARIVDAINPAIAQEPGMAYRASAIANHIQHVGWADPGTLDGASNWRICAVTYDDTDAYVISVTWPAGSRSFSYEWDERASYTYS